MNIKKSVKKRFMGYIGLILISFMGLGLCSCQKEEPDKDDQPETPVIVPDEKMSDLEITDEGQIIFYASDDYYRYGPSIIEYEDGSMDAWFASPGNSGSQWDYITYRHSQDGENWSKEQVVLRPTPGSKDQCSVCDPGVIYFDGYYYLAYTATEYYEGKGTYNMAFAARSSYPDGPFEKWNGSGWGGDPEPIIFYDGGLDNWGIGEVSFVIKDDDLFIYYTYIDIADKYIGLCKADLVDDWPSTIRYKGPALYREDPHDSVEAVYDEKTELFLLFTIKDRLTEDSSLIVYGSKDGKKFDELASTWDGIEEFAHNMGVAKSESGWIDSDEEVLFGYAYGRNWGRWNVKLQHFSFSVE